MRSMSSTSSIAFLLAALAGPAQAYLADMRITEVDPWNEKIEVMNLNGGLFQLTSEIPTPYNYDFNNFKRMGIVPGFVFTPNSIWVFTFPELSTWAGDCWLYSSESYDSPSALIHGVQWGTPPPERCNSEIAALALKWPGKSATCPAPPPGCTLAWDYDGYTPLDWYVDSTPTMGSLNDGPPGSVDEAFEGPNAAQGFETPALGDPVTALKGWTMSASGGRFAARFVGDVNGVAGTRPGSGSQRWLRVRDTDPEGANTFSSPAVQLGGVRGYRCVFYVNQEIAPTATGAAPALVIQNFAGASQWADGWGVRFTNGGVEAAVLDGGGPAAATQLYPLAGSTGVGQWVRIELRLDLENLELAASVGGGEPVRLPIAPTGNPQKMRLTYQGGGSGNTQDMLLDDVALSPYSPPVNAAEGWEKYK